MGAANCCGCGASVGYGGGSFGTPCCGGGLGGGCCTSCCGPAGAIGCCDGLCGGGYGGIGGSCLSCCSCCGGAPPMYVSQPVYETPVFAPAPMTTTTIIQQPPVVINQPIIQQVYTQTRVPQPYPVTVTQHVPIQVGIPQPYPVHVKIPQPYPVQVPIVKPVPVKVGVPQPYPVPVVRPVTPSPVPVTRPVMQMPRPVTPPPMMIPTYTPPSYIPPSTIAAIPAVSQLTAPSAPLFDMNQVRLAGEQLSAVGEYSSTNPQVYTFLYGLNGQQILGTPGQANPY